MKRPRRSIRSGLDPVDDVLIHIAAAVFVLELITGYWSARWPVLGALILLSGVVATGVIWWDRWCQSRRLARRDHVGREVCVAYGDLVLARSGLLVAQVESGRPDLVRRAEELVAVRERVLCSLAVEYLRLDGQPVPPELLRSAGGDSPG